ncbi:MAG: hypothetical protein RIF33_18290 [Cyclobacteriaceae bacterium]
MARVFASISLVLILIIQSGGSYLLIKGLQYRLKEVAHEEISAGLTSDQLIIIKSDQATSMIWTEDDEFQWNGLMFDIVYTEEHGGVTWYYCYQDEDETKLLAFWESYLQSQPKDDSHLSFISSLEWLFGNYLTSDPFDDIQSRYTLAENFTPALSCQLRYMAYLPDTPPPQFS